MSYFIEVTMQAERCPPGCRLCETACPVDIFAWEDAPARTVVVPENADECTLCDLCLEVCPVDALTVTKLY